MKMSKYKKAALLRLCVSAVLTLIALIITNTVLAEKGWYIKIIAYLPAFFAVGALTLKKAFLGIIRGQVFDENFLMSLAAVCALCLGECFEAVAILFFSGVGELFEKSATDKVRQSVASLALLCPDSARVIRDGKEVELPSSKVEVGDICLTRAGERIVTDGIVTKGFAALDCSAITGESTPVEVSEGDEVTGGFIDLDGTLMIRVTRRAENSGAARIISMVEDSAMKKTSAEKFITRFSVKYTPCVVVAALLIAILLPLFSITDTRSAVYSALCFLVISCPCALVISVPLAFFGAIGGSAKKGVLFKSNQALESMADLGVVIFDKTGTLTKGSFGIGEVIPHGISATKEELLTLAYAAEESSSHPISKALTEHIKGLGLQISKQDISDIHEIRGMGRVCVYKGERVLAGNAKLFARYGVSLPENAEHEGMSCVYVARGSEYVGCITLWDTPKSDSANAVKVLAEKGIKTVMLTGDGRESAKKIADVLGISEYKCELLPEDKVKLTESYIKEKGKRKKRYVAFVGDGINDAPSLARADIGIAMGQLGSDAAIEASDVVIVNDSLMKVAHSVDTAKRAMRIAKENIIFSIGVKFIFLILSAFGITGMIAAVFADVGVSVIAILNAMRTLRV